MPSEAIQTSPRNRGNAFREAALVAGVSVDGVLRARTLGHLPRTVLIGAGLLTGGAMVALAHLVGADVRGFTGGQAGLLAGLLPEGSDQKLQP